MHGVDETGNEDTRARALSRDLARLLATCVDYHDGVSQRHSTRVAWIAKEIAAALGVDEASAFFGGLVHDVGALELEDSVVTHARHGFEHVLARQHPLRGASLLRPLTSLQPLAEAVAAHHERLDGSGFPRGLARDDVPLAGAILGLADELELTLRNVPSSSREAALAAHVRGARAPRFASGLLEAAVASFPRWGARVYDLASLGAALDGLRLPLPAGEDLDERLVTAELTWLVRRVLDAKLGRSGPASIRTAILSHRIARALGEAPWEATWVAMLHELGALALPRILVESREALGPSERALFERHAELTREMLAALPALSHLAHAAGSVFEAFHGRGLAGREARAADPVADEIPLAARIVAYASVFERAHAAVEGASLEEALDVVRMQVGSTLDPALAEAALDVLSAAGQLHVGPHDPTAFVRALGLETVDRASDAAGARRLVLTLERDLARRDEHLAQLEAELAARTLRLEAQVEQLALGQQRIEALERELAERVIEHEAQVARSEASRERIEHLERELLHKSRLLDEALSRRGMPKVPHPVPHPPSEPPALVRDPAEAALLFDEGLDHARNGAWAAALAVWERALELDPGHRMLLANLEIARRKLAA